MYVAVYVYTCIRVASGNLGARFRTTPSPDFRPLLVGRRIDDPETLPRRWPPHAFQGFWRWNLSCSPRRRGPRSRIKRAVQDALGADALRRHGAGERPAAHAETPPRLHPRSLAPAGELARLLHAGLGRRRVARSALLLLVEHAACAGGLDLGHGLAGRRRGLQVPLARLWGGSGLALALITCGSQFWERSGEVSCGRRTIRPEVRTENLDLDRRRLR